MKKKYPKLPIGIDDFEKLRLGEFGYVDKTNFIKDIVDASFEVALFARPRRFGKTLNLSMLRYFFDVNYQKPENMGEKPLFEGLNIAKNEEFCKQYMNKYPVIFLSLKDLSFETEEHFIAEYKALISEEFKKYNYLLNSQELTMNYPT